MSLEARSELAVRMEGARPRWLERLARPWASWLEARGVADDLLQTRTTDGAVLAVERLHPSVDNTVPGRGAVVLCHGLGSNGLGLNFPSRSLATYLAQAGFDCFVPDLRGARRSQAPSPSWSLEHYLDQDLPALLDLVQRTSGVERVHWVGHSMGGILLMLYAIEHPGAPLGRAVAVASSLDYRQGGSIYRHLAPFRGMLGALQDVPFGLMSHWFSPLGGLGVPLPAEALNFWRPNVEPEVIRQLLAGGFDRIPVALLHSLGTTFDRDGFARADGSVAYLAQAHGLCLPMCLIAGSRDVQCPVESVEATAALLSGCSEIQVLRLGRGFGQAEDYGHFDLLVGRRAEREVWPAIRDWLAA